jgi:CheY-like chemotaxis protein
MVHFRDVSIRHKLLFINVFTTGIALLMASTAFITYERLRFQEDISRHLVTVADVVATSARPALVAHDPAAGENLLHALLAEPRILAACLDLAEGGSLVCLGNAARADHGDLLLSRPIFDNGRKLGVIWIRFDGRVSFEVLRHDMAMVSLAIAVCFVIAVLLSSKLQRTISGPVLRLAATAREVALGHNYALRAEKSGQDEIGRLVDSFNEMLAQLGHNADLARDGQEAVAAVQARRYDLVLMDVQMPRMDGMAATRAIRALGSPANAVPIVALTAHALEGYRDAYLSAGMDDYLSKPIRREALTAILARWSARAPSTVPRSQPSDHGTASHFLAADSALESMRSRVSSERFGELLQLYFTAAQAHLARIGTLADQRDFRALSREAHSLRNSVGIVGAHDLVALAQRLQGACDAEQDAEVAALAESVITEIHALNAALHARYGR